MRQTAIAWPKRYFDIDTLRFETDTLETIPSYSYNEMIEDDGHQENRGPSHYYAKNLPRFAPKDNDFEDECRRVAEEKRIKERVKKEKIDQERMIKERYEYWQKEQERKLLMDEKQKRREKERKEREEQEERERQREASIPKFFIYHPVCGAKILEWDEYSKLLNDGWYDTPAKFPNSTHL